MENYGSAWCRRIRMGEYCDLWVLSLTFTIQKTERIFVIVHCRLKATISLVMYLRSSKFCQEMSTKIQVMKLFL